MEHGALRGGDPQDIGAWALRVYQTVKELLDPEYAIGAAAERMRHYLRALDSLPTCFRRQR